MKTQLLNRISFYSNICHGKACIRGMRFPVEMILDMLGSEMSKEEILEDHAELEEENILACLEYVKQVDNL